MSNCSINKFYLNYVKKSVTSKTQLGNLPVSFVISYVWFELISPELPEIFVLKIQLWLTVFYCNLFHVVWTNTTLDTWFFQRQFLVTCENGALKLTILYSYLFHVILFFSGETKKAQAPLVEWWNFIFHLKARPH